MAISIGFMGPLDHKKSSDLGVHVDPVGIIGFLERFVE